MIKNVFVLILCLSCFLSNAGDWPFQASEIPQPQEFIFSEEDIAFDTPGGKITKVKGQTTFYKLCDLKSFFEKNLLELGWSKFETTLLDLERSKEEKNSDTMKFKRDSSTVEIKLTEAGFNTINILIELVSSQQDQV